jgi:ectoine hydroxylase-related dioxygenase (phytanoyl-CoA dioxygenase family)
MNGALPRPIAADEIDAYARDGVVCLRGLFAGDWIAALARGLERNLAEPGQRSRIYDRDAQDRTFFYDSDSWQRIPEYERFVRDSPCAEVAATLMGSAKANLFFDAVFIRGEGQQFRTPWHQDEPYWSISGFQAISIWMPLVAVERKSALEFVPGSHVWPQKYRQLDFAELNPDSQQGIATARLEGEDWLALPDFDAERDRWNITAWDMEPGDCACFNARLFHGGSGRLSAGRELRVFNTKWLGDDVRCAFRPYGMDPDHSPKMRAAGMNDGDPIDDRLYPRFWPRGGAPERAAIA